MTMQSRTRFPLGKSEAITLTNPQGWSIKSHAGRLWITQSNKSEDMFLSAGEAYVAIDAGVLVVEAISNALVSFESPNHAKSTQRATKFAAMIPTGILEIIS